MTDNGNQFDKHGFIIEEGENSKRCHEYKEQHVIKRDLKAWQDLKERNKDIDPQKIITLVRRGVPPDCRPYLWKKLLESETLKSSSSFSYKANVVAVREQLVDLGISEYGHSKALDVLAEAEHERQGAPQPKGHISWDALRLIFLDVGRSFPEHQLFMGNTEAAVEGRAALFRLLALYVRYNPGTGYCQGMSYLGGMFLMYLEEEDAFWCLVSLLERQKYLLGYYDKHLNRIQRHAAVFGKLLRQKLPRLHKNLGKHGVTEVMYIVPWFMCLFTSLPCWDTVLAIWDFLLLHGTNSIFCVGLAIMKNLHDEVLLKNDLSTILPALLHLSPEVVQYDRLVPCIWKTVIEPWEIRLLQAIVQDDEVKASLTPKASNRRRRRSRPGPIDVPANRSTKTRQQRALQEVDNNQPSVLQRFVNVFKPKPQPKPFRRRASIGRSARRVSTAKRGTGGTLAQRQSRSRASVGRTGRRVSTRVTPRDTSFQSPRRVQQDSDSLTPVRRSPRLSAKKAACNIDKMEGTYHYSQ